MEEWYLLLSSVYVRSILAREILKTTISLLSWTHCRAFPNLCHMERMISTTYSQTPNSVSAITAGHPWAVSIHSLLTMIPSEPLVPLTGNVRGHLQIHLRVPYRRPPRPLALVCPPYLQVSILRQHQQPHRPQPFNRPNHPVVAASCAGPLALTSNRPLKNHRHNPVFPGSVV